MTCNKSTHGEIVFGVRGIYYWSQKPWDQNSFVSYENFVEQWPQVKIFQTCHFQQFGYGAVICGCGKSHWIKTFDALHVALNEYNYYNHSNVIHAIKTIARKGTPTHAYTQTLIDTVVMVDNKPQPINSS